MNGTLEQGSDEASLSTTEDLISILVPARNSGQFISRTLDSLVSQTHRNTEIIVVDDGSTDDTIAIVNAYARRDSRIRLFLNAERRGPGGARNAAAARAHGAYLAPCDSDDLWRKDKLERQLAALKRAPPNVGVAYCWSVGLNEEDEVIFPNWARREAEGDVLWASIVDSLPGSGSVILVRRAFFDQVGGFPEDIYNGDEWQICIALAGVCEFALVREFLVGYRLRPGSTSSDYLSVDEYLGQSTRWIKATWADLPDELLRRRAFTVNRYVAFVATRSRNYFAAFKYQFRAIAARPSELAGPTMLNFFLMVLTQIFGIQRYYHQIWLAPKRWEGAPGGDVRATERVT